MFAEELGEGHEGSCLLQLHVNLQLSLKKNLSLKGEVDHLYDLTLLRPRPYPLPFPQPQNCGGCCVLGGGVHEKDRLCCPQGSSTTRT